MPDLVVIGGGLAGTEAAWQAAQGGLKVVLYEMRPQQVTPAHVSDHLAELVCSNSLGSKLVDRAPGLLKEELRRLGSLCLRHNVGMDWQSKPTRYQQDHKMAQARHISSTALPRVTTTLDQSLVEQRNQHRTSRTGNSEASRS